MGRLVGIEPTSARATIWCVNHFATAAILKLYHYKWWRGTDSNRRTLRERIYSPPRLAASLPLHKNIPLASLWCRREDLNPQPTDYDSVALPIELHRLISQKVARDGIEPPTQGFSVLCSTD
jgi:hypothetical protein